MKPRIVEPEWLDHLPSDDPRAIVSRADLRRINLLMGHAAQITRLFLKYTETRDGGRLRIADLGGGDGTLLLRLAQEWSARGFLADADILDARSAVSRETVAAFRKLGWSIHIKTVDALHWAYSRAGHHGSAVSLGDPGLNDQCQPPFYDLSICNLFLHHFDGTDLAGLLGGIADSANLFIACEPHRSSLGLWGSRALRLIRCSAVTLHDARISVHAGFAGDELSHFWPQGPAPSDWHLAEGRKFFSHYFVAKRR